MEKHRSIETYFVYLDPPVSGFFPEPTPWEQVTDWSDVQLAIGNKRAVIDEKDWVRVDNGIRTNYKEEMLAVCGGPDSSMEGFVVAHVRRITSIVSAS